MVSIVLDLNAVSLPLTAAAAFGRGGRFEVEIGVGKGRFLLEQAAAYPETCFLGVERARKYLHLTAVRAARRNLGNVRLLHTTAEDLLFRCLTPGSVDAMHLYFPDPWPKKRHRKRRFITEPNLERMAEVLKPGGLLLIKTDHDGYGETIAEVLAGQPALEEVDVNQAFAALPPTSFELKYAKEGRIVHRFARRRRVER